MSSDFRLSRPDASDRLFIFLENWGAVDLTSLYFLWYILCTEKGEQK